MSIAKTNFKSDFHALVEAQRKIVSSSGYSFDLADDVWSLHGKDLNFNRLEEFATCEFVASLKSIFAKIIEDKKVGDGTVANYYSSLLNLLTYAYDASNRPTEDISDEVLKGWVTSSSISSYLASIKAFIQKAQKKDPEAFPNISAEALSKIHVVQSEYIDVLTLDPKKGPWLESEVLAQDAALERAYTAGDLPAEKYLIAQIFRTYGPRNVQLANLKVGDVRLSGLHDVKQSSIRILWAKNNRPIETSPWRPVRADIEDAMRSYLDMRLANVPRRQWDNLPFFTPEGLPGTWQKKGGKPQANKATGFEGHCMPKTMGRRFERIMNSFDLITHRTGEPKPMSFNSHRERHTIGTRLALQGLNAAEIADILLHTTPESCEAYVKLGIQHFQLMREKLDVPMTPVAANFLNEPIKQEELFEGDLDVIVARDIPDLPVTGGAKCGDCSFKIDGSAPWACLTCPKFRVFADADLSLLWDELQHRKAYLYDDRGEFSYRYDPSMERTFQRYEQALINAEARRREYSEQHNLVEA